MTGVESPARTWLAVRIALIIVVVAGLAVDAYVHFDLASDYDPVKTDTLSQGDLFRAQAVVSVLAALLLIVRPRRWTAAVAAVVAGSALAAVLVYRYVDIGKIGPIPSMYEPSWYTEKTITTIAEAAAFVAAVALLFLPWRRSGRSIAGAHRRATDP
jgi:glucan phosphoethanolaminetransferase (alkaline phosphatase superfamily)